MTLTTHVTIGALIGTGFQNPVLGFALGFASHFLVDMIPHGDHFLSNDFRIHKKVKIPVIYTTADALLGILVLCTLLITTSYNHLPTFVAAMAASVLPDIIVGIHDVTKSKLIRWFNTLHFVFHDFFVHKYGDIPLKLSIATQSIFVAIALSLIQ